MKKIYYILPLLTLIMLLVSCKKDEASESIFVEPLVFHFKYDKFGDTKPFTNAFNVSVVNTTEQITVRYETDLWGKLTLDELLPGEYTISINGKLTIDEVSEITGEPATAGFGLGGFISNVKLKLGTTVMLDIPIKADVPSALIFKELYYCGSKTPAGINYRNDNFYTIHNNSNLPIELNNIYIGNVENYGTTGLLWPGEIVGNYTNVYAQVLWKIVADDTQTILAPGQSIVIATMGAPHNQEDRLNPNSPVDLSGADYEAYNDDPENTYTNYPAKNMKRAFWPDYGDLWKISVFGRGMILVEATEEEFSQFETVLLPEQFWSGGERYDYWYCKKIPYDYVIDAVDLIENNTTTNSKRFNQPLDNGFATVAGTYTGKSVIRKVDKTVGEITYYKDTNNSTEDFEINDKPLSK